MELFSRLFGGSPKIRGLINAVERRQVSRVTRILQKKPDLINERYQHTFSGDNDYTALHIAAAQGDIGMLELLLSRGADPNMRDAHGSTALHWAVKATQRSADAVKMLIKHGAEVNAVSTGGWTPLDRAIHSLRPEAAGALMAHGGTAQDPENQAEVEGAKEIARQRIRNIGRRL